MKTFNAFLITFVFGASGAVLAQNCPYDPRCLGNPYGAGNPYGPVMNQYAPHSAKNPYATEAPRIYDSKGNYRGQLSTNPYAPDSTSNPYGRYGSPNSPDGINNPYGAGNPHGNQKFYVVPTR